MRNAVFHNRRDGPQVANITQRIGPKHDEIGQSTRCKHAGRLLLADCLSAHDGCGPKRVSCRHSDIANQALDFRKQCTVRVTPIRIVVRAGTDRDTVLVGRASQLGCQSGRSLRHRTSIAHVDGCIEDRAATLHLR